MWVWSWLASKQKKYNTESLNSVSVLRVYKEGERKTNLRSKGSKGAWCWQPESSPPQATRWREGSHTCRLSSELHVVCMLPTPTTPPHNQTNQCKDWGEKGKHFWGNHVVWKTADFLIFGSNLNLDTWTVYFWGWLNPHSPKNLLIFTEESQLKNIKPQKMKCKDIWIILLSKVKIHKILQLQMPGVLEAAAIVSSPDSGPWGARDFSLIPYSFLFCFSNEYALFL